MRITTKALSAHDLRSIALRVGSSDYSSNLAVDTERTRGNQYRFKLGALDSHGPGSRTSWTGRHGPYACWHAFRDVLAAIFLEDPKATVSTAMATYRGARSFLADFPDTAYRNVGSMVAPAYMDELCQCSSQLGPYVTELEGKYL